MTDTDEVNTMATRIFKDMIEFENREDKTVNGVSPDFAIMHLNYEDDNNTKTGCWNCESCDHCENCSNSEHCRYSTGSKNCSYCDENINCTHNTECTNCKDCEHCDDCFDCVDCFHSEHCTTLSIRLPHILV